MKTPFSLMARFVAIVCIIFNLNWGGVNSLYAHGSLPEEGSDFDSNFNCG